MKPGLSSRRLRRLSGSSIPAEGPGGIVRARVARGSPPYNNQAKQGWKLDLTSIAALLPPEQVVFGQNAPVATCLRSSEQVPRLQEGEDIESQLEGKEDMRLGGSSIKAQTVTSGRVSPGAHQAASSLLWTRPLSS